MKIVKLDIDDNTLLGGIDAVALVEHPAIEEDFYMFSKQQFAETYNDYPQAAVEAAKQGIKRNKELGNKCATQVGKVRAQQLANGEPLSLDTIRRMRSFLIRQKDNYELAKSRKDYDACGYISYLLWGGEAALPWAEKKLRQAGEEFESLEDACWPGYEAIGTKIKDGREVPNCVPKTQMSKEDTEKLILEGIIKENLFAQVNTLDGIPVYSTPEEAEAKAKEIGCEGYHEHTTPEGLKVYMPCSHHGRALETIQDNAQREFNVDVSALPNYINELPEDIQDELISKMLEVGIKEEDLSKQGYVKGDTEKFLKEVFSVSSTPNLSSITQAGGRKVLFRYNGPRDSKNRDFCARVLDANLLFRKEDINKMSLTGTNKEFGVYDIFTYKGSFNCRHRWSAELWEIKNDDGLLGEQLAADITYVSDATAVNSPVIQKNGVADKQTFAAYEELDEKQMLIGPLMTPYKMIKRIDGDGNEYFVYFDETGIEKLAYKMMKDKLLDSVNIEHNPEQSVKDAYLVESWIVKDPEKDKANFYGFKPIAGQWFGMYKIADKEIWNEYVKTGKVKGFSVEGFFSEKLLASKF